MRSRNAFTMIEVVIVVLVIGIIAAIAAPRLMNISKDACDQSVRENLRVIRQAIEFYKATNSGTLPPCTGSGADFHAALAPFIHGDFPECSVGPAKNNLVDPTPAAVTKGVGNPSTGWKFNVNTGEFICNLNKPMDTDPSIRYDEL